MRNNVIDTSLKYTGEVSYRYIVNGKATKEVKKNSALPGLFEILTKALAGYNISAEIPVSIDLVNSVEGGSSLLNRTVYLSASRYYKYDENVEDSWSTYYTAAILPEDLIASIGTSDTFFLVLKSVTKRLAYISVDSEVIESIKNGAQLIIDWRLYFSNSSSQQ